MYSENAFGNEASVEERTDEREADDVAVVDDTPEMRASVEQDIQAKVDYADERMVDGRLFGQTLQAEEEMQAREWEIARTRERFDRRPDSDREARTRRVAARGSNERRIAFQRRAASVDPFQDPDRPDPREQLEREELGAVNQQAAAIAREVRGSASRAAVSRHLAERVAQGANLLSASVAVMDAERKRPGTVVPIGALEEIGRQEVSIAGRVETLWQPSHPSIAQVGLIADGGGRTRVTIWKKSQAPWIEEGERIRIHGAARTESRRMTDCDRPVQGTHVLILILVFLTLDRNVVQKLTKLCIRQK